jgi:hypothetical protein
MRVSTISIILVIVVLRADTTLLVTAGSSWLLKIIVNQWLLLNTSVSGAITRNNIMSLIHRKGKGNE